MLAKGDCLPLPTSCQPLPRVLPERNCQLLWGFQGHSRGAGETPIRAVAHLEAFSIALQAGDSVLSPPEELGQVLSRKPLLNSGGERGLDWFPGSCQRSALCLSLPHWSATDCRSGVPPTSGLS